MNSYSKESVADRYEQRKQAQGWYGDTVQSMPEGTSVQLDCPFSDAHEKIGTVVSEIARQVIVRVDGEEEVRVISKPAVEVLTSA